MTWHDVVLHRSRLLTDGATVTKNCDPFVFGPALAMLTVYGRSCRSDGWNSSSNSPPQMLSPPVPLPAPSTLIIIWILRIQKIWRSKTQTGNWPFSRWTWIGWFHAVFENSSVINGAITTKSFYRPDGLPVNRVKALKNIDHDHGKITYWLCHYFMIYKLTPEGEEAANKSSDLIAILWRHGRHLYIL